MNKNKKILLIDDGPDITLPFSIVLEDNGSTISPMVEAEHIMCM